VSRATKRVAWTLATWFGCGLVPRAPGTVGTLGAIPLYLLAARGGRPIVAAVAVAVTLVGVKDPQVVVIDEVAGLLVTMLPAPLPSWRAVLAGFLLFRLFDVLKPWLVRDLERLPAGWGIVADDVGAGVLGAACMFALLACGAFS
jgi:phosphatidylglycerophosphatase A